MRARLLTEFVGTFIFLSTIALSGPTGPLAPLVIGLALTAMVYMGGHVSGAHYNPAVSFALFLRKVIALRTMLLYWIAQLVAGSLAFVFAFLIGAHGSGFTRRRRLPHAERSSSPCDGPRGRALRGATALTSAQC